MRTSGWSAPSGGAQGGRRRGNEECRRGTVCVCVCAQWWNTGISFILITQYLVKFLPTERTSAEIRVETLL